MKASHGTGIVETPLCWKWKELKVSRLFHVGASIWLWPLGNACRDL